MFVWCREAAACASVLNRCSCAGIERGGKRQDLQGDTTVERELLGLIDDPHATASDFAEDPEIAHDAQLGGGDGFRHRQLGSIPHSRAAQLGHHLQGGEQFSQSLGMLRVLGGKFTRIERLARLEALQELLDQLGLDRVGPCWRSAAGTCMATVMATLPGWSAAASRRGGDGP